MPRPAPPERRCLPVEEWPPADQEAWARALEPGDVLEGAGAAAQWSNKTRRTVVAAYGRWLGFLELRGGLDRTCAPSARIAESPLRAYVSQLQAQVQPITVRNRLRDLGVAVRAMEPGADLRLVCLLARRLALQATPSRAKGARMVEADRLAELGIEIMAEAESLPVRNAIRRATRYRNGLMIALLACRPQRRGEFVRLDLNAHIRMRDGAAMIYIAPDETKTGRPYSVSWPKGLIAPLRRYLDTYRPMLLKGNRSGRLWITHKGTPMTEDGFYAALTKITKEKLGIAINPHAFRDSLATSMILDNPANVSHAAALLGHSSTNTTNEHYNQAPARDAQERYHAILESLAEPDE
jgi:integrase